MITGGSAGIGLAAARRLLAAGARVCIAARDPARLEAAARELGPAAVHALPLDVRDEAAVARGVADATARLGGLDLVINNAGYAHPGAFADLPPAVFQDMLEVNYLGMVRVTRAALPELKRGRGHVSFVSSMLGFMGLYGYSAYAAAKYAVAGFAECLRQELTPEGVTVSLCYPPTTDTPGLATENRIKPPETWAIEGSSTMYTPEDVARALLAGIAGGRFEILVGLDSTWIWRLQRFAPWLVRAVIDRMLARYRAKPRR